MEELEEVLSKLKSSDDEYRQNAAKSMCLMLQRGREWLHLSEKERNSMQDAEKYQFCTDQLRKKPERIVRTLIDLLKDKNRQIQRYVIQALGILKDTRAVMPLIECLNSGDRDIRSETIKALAKIGDNKAIKPIIRLTKDEYYWVRKVAIENLALFGSKEAIEPLIRALDDSSYQVQEAAARALGTLGDNRAIQPLNACRRRSRSVKKNAAVALSKLGREGIATLITWLDDGAYKVRNIAIEVLSGVRDEMIVDLLIARLRDAHTFVRHKAAFKLGDLGDKKAVEPLIELLKDKDTQVRMITVKALGKLGDKRAIEPLMMLLKTEKTGIKQVIVESLKKLKARNAIELMLEKLQDENWLVRKKTIEALGDIGDSRAIEPLLKCIRESKRWEISKISVEALSKLGDEGIMALISCLSDGNTHVIPYIAQKLSALGESRAVEPLIACLKIKDLYIRQDVVEALGKLGDERAIDPLVKLLKGSWVDLQKKIVSALSRLGDAGIKALIECLEIDDSLARREIAAELKKVRDPKAIHPLIRRLKDENWQVQQQAEFALANIGILAIDPLIEALKEADENLRLKILFILNNIGDRRAIEPLISCLQDNSPEVKGFAVDTLRKFNDIETLKPLLAHLNDKDPVVRYKVAEALADLGSEEVISALLDTLKEYRDSLLLYDWKVQGALVSALINLGDKAMKYIRPLLKDERPWIREAAVSALGGVEDPESTAVLIKCLKEENLKIFNIVQNALIGKGDRVINPLIACLKDEDELVRRNAVQVLDHWRHKKEVSEAVLSLFKDPDSNVRLMAIKLFRDKYDLRSVEPLIACLKDEMSDIRQWAIRGLEMLRDRRALEPLTELLRDEDKIVRESAAHTLGILKDVRAVKKLLSALVDDELKIQQQVGFALNNIGRYAVPSEFVTQVSEFMAHGFEKYLQYLQNYYEPFEYYQAPPLNTIRALFHKDPELARAPVTWIDGLEKVIKERLKEAARAENWSEVAQYFRQSMEHASWLLEQIKLFQDRNTIFAHIELFKKSLRERLVGECYESPLMEQYTIYLLELAELAAKLGEDKTAQRLFYNAFNDFRVVVDGCDVHYRTPGGGGEIHLGVRYPPTPQWVQVFSMESDLALKLKAQSYGHKICLLSDYPYLQKIYQKNPFFLFEGITSKHGIMLSWQLCDRLPLLLDTIKIIEFPFNEEHKTWFEKIQQELPNVCKRCLRAEGFDKYFDLTKIYGDVGDQQTVLRLSQAICHYIETKLISEDIYRDEEDYYEYDDYHKDIHLPLTLDVVKLMSDAALPSKLLDFFFPECPDCFEEAYITIFKAIIKKQPEFAKQFIERLEFFTSLNIEFIEAIPAQLIEKELGDLFKKMAGEIFHTDDLRQLLDGETNWAELEALGETHPYIIPYLEKIAKKLGWK
ncbi:MAG: HEAT repeat domain-containing protein [Candidatus Helarchaeota archaeon]